MPRNNIDRFQNAVGLLTSMNRPWDEGSAEPRVEAEAAPLSGDATTAKARLHAIAAALALWVVSIKSIFPEG